ncbi:MAG TPA: hypothetical protein VI796_00985 [Candidatus Thermoplasmatota archaeon]|nr:hypothetical protein [Candidatus Thermoplasmatota archaeon]
MDRSLRTSLAASLMTALAGSAVFIAVHAPLIAFVPKQVWLGPLLVLPGALLAGALWHTWGRRGGRPAPIAFGALFALAQLPAALLSLVAGPLDMGDRGLLAEQGWFALLGAGCGVLGGAVVLVRQRDLSLSVRAGLATGAVAFPFAGQAVKVDLTGYPGAPFFLAFLAILVASGPLLAWFERRLAMRAAAS